MNWNIEATDMLSMWKQSTKHAFIDTTHNHSTQGITNLLKRPSEQEGVRNAFRRLFQEEDGDTEAKWERILKFMDYINGRLTELFPSSSIYQQTKEAVITYLNLWDPDHNYRYKPAPANNWAQYIEYGDWTTGRMFSLKKYYKMCDEIHDVVKDHKELIQIHQRRFADGLPDYDKNLHILTFDVLYCFWGYKDTQQKALEEYEDALRQQRLEELEEKLSDIDEDLRKRKEEIKDLDLVGCQVHHFTHGAGIVTSVTDQQITVEYADEGFVKSQYPQTILRGLLQFNDTSILEALKNNDMIGQEIDSLKKQRDKIEEEIKKITS